MTKSRIKSALAFICTPDLMNMVKDDNISKYQRSRIMRELGSREEDCCDGKCHLVEKAGDISHECWHRSGPLCNEACKETCQGCANTI